MQITFNVLKKVITVKPKRFKLNSDYIIGFLAINPLKQNPTWIYLDKILLTNIYL
jgi:hypothetical protein